MAAAADSIVVLQNATWADYERMLEMRGDKSAPRIAYAEGMLEILRASDTHERVNATIGRLFEVWCDRRGIDWTSLGSWTQKSKAVEKGAEPDECYVFGSYKRKPKRPDLVIEVIWTSGGIDKRSIYLEFGIPELWFWKDDRLQLFVLRDGKYVPAKKSSLQPKLDFEQLLSFVHVLPTSKAVREYRALLASKA